MENIIIDSDATGAFAVGVGTSQQTPKNYLDLQPNWVADGYGIRGPQRPKVRESAQPAPMPLGDGGQRNNPTPPLGEVCNPGDGADTDLKYIKATQFVDGVWQCVWLPTCAGTCDT